jgi:hypothetical protein
MRLDLAAVLRRDAVAGIPTDKLIEIWKQP